MQTMAETQNQLIKAHDVVDDIFRKILPNYGLGVREAQVQLSHNMLDALHDRKIALTEAGVGIGKTYAYMVAVIVSHIYLQENMWVRTSYHHDSNFNMNTPMPVVISTSSIALQKAIVHEYIPFLSKVLMENGIIDMPIQYVIRKGKSNYVCDKLLRKRLTDVNLEQKNQMQREALLSLRTVFDLNMVQGLSAYDRKQVCVPACCSRRCSESTKCRYQHLLKSAKSPNAFFQICNHNYLLADTMHRRSGKEPLLPNYKAIIIDEAHKLFDAAQQMYGHILVEEDVLLLVKRARSIDIESKKYARQMLQFEKAISSFFKAMSSSVNVDPEEDVQLFEYLLTKDMKAKLFSLIMALKEIRETLDNHAQTALVSRFDTTKDKLFLFYRQEVEYVRYVEYTNETKSLSLCAVPKNLKKQFSDDLWSMPVPFILTSGTLAVNGRFNHIRSLLGMEGSTTQRRLMESMAQSPFDYKQNCMLHLPNDLPYPNVDNPVYLDATAQKIEELIHATHGHTLVLFTSYKMMFEVCDRVQKRNLPIPVMAAWRNANNIIDDFKGTENAVLFATGAFWEGVDFPGDIVSSLIIVTLPFNVPDPLSKYEQSQYPSVEEFISKSIVPDMQRKLKQGFGRAIRTETDTCAVTILDRRARVGGKYNQAVMDALPKCRTTEQINTVAEFIRQAKPLEYFQNKGEADNV